MNLVGADASGRKRVLCPLCPQHTVWEDELKRHLAKCRKKPENRPLEPWRRVDINLVGQTPAQTLSRDDVDLASWADTLRKLYRDVVEREGETLETEILNHPGLEERLKQLENQKHAVQQASLIGHMEKHGFLDPRTTIIAEFGCGRGELSRYISRARALKDMDARQRFLLVDRAGPRMKFDNKLVKDYAEMRGEHNVGGVVYKRLKVDIKDIVVNAEMLQELELAHGDDSELVIVSKHLCGCATDLTLQLMLGQRPPQLRGSVIALCCRQLCSYETYPLAGRRWLQETAGVEGPEAFYAISRMTTWVLCGNRGLSDPENERLGHMARRVIDFGRLHALREAGYKNSRLVQYVDPQVSPENVCLIVEK
ncbi:hypothetical protein TRICI_003348 [Trichomonascus ciferrii]|uniref:tRNA:m(4)X modification enzyme TRM13 n=1 Tax=Trichomonascus ciferrii TaxID=44093 RepID=A0A642V482_9ASCO|nr:hypothetical protein TRICI_003348 [Trichomonascus ciferrii]